MVVIDIYNIEKLIYRHVVIDLCIEIEHRVDAHRVVHREDDADLVAIMIIVIITKITMRSMVWPNVWLKRNEPPEGGSQVDDHVVLRVGGEDRSQVNAIQALSQLSYSPTSSSIVNANPAAKFRRAPSKRGAL